MRNNLDMMSLILQVYNLILLIQDYNNKDLMNELKNQDENYFKKILLNQEKIIKLLEERSDTLWKKE